MTIIKYQLKTDAPEIANVKVKIYSHTSPLSDAPEIINRHLLMVLCG